MSLYLCSSTTDRQLYLLRGITVHFRHNIKKEKYIKKQVRSQFASRLKPIENPMDLLAISKYIIETKANMIPGTNPYFFQIAM